MSVPVEASASTKWPVVQLSEVASLVRGVSYPKTDARDEPTDGYVPVLRATNIQDARLVLESSLVHIAKRNVAPAQLLQPGDIVVATSSGSKHLVGKSASLQSPWRGSFGAFCVAIRPQCHIDARFLALFLQSPAYWHQISKKALGVNINNLRRGDVETLLLPLPPLTTQQQVVAEIEKQFSRLDEAVANLKRVKANLKRYKAAVLKAAVEGRLVPTKAELARHEPMELWRTVTVMDVAQVISGFTKNPKRELFARKLPYLRVANVYADELRLNDVEWIGVAESEVEKLLLRRGDLLVVEGNGSPDQIGRVALWDGSIRECVHQNHLIKVRFSDEVLPKWALTWLLSPGGRHEIEQVSSSTSGLHTLSTGKVARLPFPLPPLAEQHRIVAEVDRRLSIVREVESEVDANLKRAQVLRQATLAKAFAT
ncbi:restriction endonuclease subunit S [Accumulibacter sp.]|uniref:restriction endonuclease subunit S n=1 Tax=Accumulibacter sp. TaxID=2053492 RepID=UPI00261F738F|nr:restriction endonuclease subunit S [Accumulibacter sp.]